MNEDILAEIENVKHLRTIVEGPNDKKSLEEIGFTNVATINMPLYKIVEKYSSEEELLILTDLDAHGKELYKYFYSEFNLRGVYINNRLRLLLLQTPVKHIEGLSTYLDNDQRV